MAIKNLPQYSLWCYNFARFGSVTVQLSMPWWIGQGKRPLCPLSISPVFPSLPDPRFSSRVARPPSPPRRGQLAQATRRRRSARVEGPASAEPTTSLRSGSLRSGSLRPGSLRPLLCPRSRDSTRRRRTAKQPGDGWPEADPDLHLHNPDARQVRGALPPPPRPHWPPYFASFAELGLG